MRSRHSGFYQLHRQVRHFASRAASHLPPVAPGSSGGLAARCDRGEGSSCYLPQGRRGSMRMYLVVGIAGVLVNIACATAQTPEPKSTPEQMESLISQQRLTNQLLLRILETLVVTQEAALT